MDCKLRRRNGKKVKRERQLKAEKEERHREVIESLAVLVVLIIPSLLWTKEEM